MREKKAKIIMKDVKKTYNKIANDFSNTRKNPGKEFILFKPYIKNNQTIVDLGCGNGRLIPFLESLSLKIHYLGIDNNNKFLGIAKEKYPNHHFINGDYIKLPLNINSTDLLITIRSFHHVPSKTLRLRALSEMHRVIKKDGILILSVWNLWQRKYIKDLILAFIRSIITLGRYEFKDTFIKWGPKEKRYYHAFTKNEIKNLIQKSGFKILESYNKYHDYIIIAQK